MAKQNLTAKQTIARFDALEKELRVWSKLTKKKILFRIASLDLKEQVKLREQGKLEKKGELEKSIKVAIRKKSGEIEGIVFGFARHGIFLERGVGRGRKANTSLANKYKKVWLKPSLEIAVEELADLLSEKYADILAEELRILVPGIIDTKITK